MDILKSTLSSALTPMQDAGNEAFYGPASNVSTLNILAHAATMGLWLAFGLFLAVKAYKQMRPWLDAREAKRLARWQQ